MTEIKIPYVHAFRDRHGRMRYYVRRKGHLVREKISDAVIALRKEEIANRYDHLDTYLDYARSVAKTKESLMGLLAKLTRDKKKIFGYGASGRANTLIQYCGITNEMLECIIDDAPAKHGYYTPGSHIRILAREHIREENPDYVLVFAWSFIKEIAARNVDYLERGGKFIVPLPEVQIVTMKNGEIVEAGTHQSLVEKQGEYFKFRQLQAT